VGVDVLRDGTGDIAYALKDPATKAVDCEIAEEAFDHVKPRSTSRSEVDVESRIPLEPGFYLFVLMGGIIVADDMDVFSLGNIAADQVEKANPFLVAVLFHAGADNLTAEGIHSGEQRGCAIALVIMSHRLATTLLQRKPRLSPVQSLNLTFLIAGEDQRVLWRVEIETDDVFEFFLKLFVVGKFETGHPMGLESVRRPDTSYAGCTDSRGFRHGSPAPVGASHRGILERHLHNAGTDRCRNRRNAPRSGLIFENARKPTLAYRCLHRPTFMTSSPKRSAISLFWRPSAARRIMADRSLARTEVARPRFMASNFLRSCMLRIMAGATLMHEK